MSFSTLLLNRELKKIEYYFIGSEIVKAVKEKVVEIIRDRS